MPDLKKTLDAIRAGVDVLQRQVEVAQVTGRLEDVKRTACAIAETAWQFDQSQNNQNLRGGFYDDFN